MLSIFRTPVIYHGQINFCLMVDPTKDGGVMVQTVGLFSIAQPPTTTDTNAGLALL